jgi:hypothetical protein
VQEILLWSVRICCWEVFVSASDSGLDTFLFTHKVLKHVDANGIELRAVKNMKKVL